jgi:adenylate cyclase
MPGDRVRLGRVELQFRSRRFAAPRGGLAAAGRQTMREISVAEMVMVVGDIVSFSTIAETTDDRLLLENVDRLYAELRQILARHHGTLSNYVGDAFFATWEAAAVPEAARAGLAFAVEAAETVPRIASRLDLRDPGGGPLRMGWGVARGPAALSLLTGMLVTVLGDTTNVAFRLSGLAGRDGRPDVLVTEAVRRAASAGFSYTPLPAVQVKGRRQAVEVLGAGRL